VQTSKDHDETTHTYKIHDVRKYPIVYKNILKTIRLNCVSTTNKEKEVVKFGLKI
jgi:hypothetical protein